MMVSMIPSATEFDGSTMSGKTPKSDDSFPEKESQQRFEAALRGALNTPHRPLKE